MNQNIILTIVLLISVSILWFLPHPLNMTPTIAISMLSVAIFKRPSQQFGLPLLIMVITDAVIGFHSLVIVVYLSIALAGMAGYVAAIPFFS